MSSKLVVPIASVVGRPFRGVTGRLARENAIRQPGRTASTAAALMIGVALVSFASIFAASAKETVSGFIDRGMASQLVVQNQDGFTPFSGEARRELDRVPGVETTAAIRFAQVRIGKKKEGITGVDPQAWNRVYNVTKGGDVIGRLKRGEAAVSKTYAEDHHLHAGSTLTVRTITEPRLTLRVIGIYEDKASLLGKITLPNDAVARDAGVSRDSYVFVKYRPGADTVATQAAIKRVLARDFPQTEALTADEFKNDQADQLNQLLGMIYALLALSIIVSLFGIVNTLALSIAERTRELGMLRAIGTSRRQVKSMIRKESVIIATIGGVLGLALGIVLSVLFTQALDDFVLHVPVVSLFILLFLSALAGLAAAALPARRAARLNVLEALAYE
jgi:putative ABC transport system permease protein